MDASFCRTFHYPIPMNSIIINPRTRIPYSELRFRFTRSAGPGGQNVNRVSTRVELVFDILRSPSLGSEAKSVLMKSLGRKVDSAGCLRIVAQESRSQWKNRGFAIEKFSAELRKALHPAKSRTPTTATVASSEKRIAKKKHRARTKGLRKLNMGKEIE